MQLRSERLHLRPVSASDTNDLFSIYGDPETNRFNPAGPYPDIHHAESVMGKWCGHWTLHGFGYWAISSLENPGKTIGFGGISIREFDGHKINNLGYRFATDSWGKGYATELARRALQYAFDTLGLNEICAVVRDNHVASQNVLKKSGLSFCGTVNDVKNAPASLIFTITANKWYRRSE